MSGAVTILWAAAVDEAFALAQEAARESDAAILTTTAQALAGDVAATRARGAVVAITSGGADAAHAFDLGVDEVLRVEHVTRRVVETTIRSACARAESRLRRRVRPELALADVAQGLALLTAAVDQQLGPPLLAASDACLALRQEFDRLVVTADRLQQWAALVAPTGEMEAVARLRAQHPANSVHQKLHDMRVSLVRAEALIALLREVSTADTSGGGADVSSVIAQFRDLVAPHVSAWASLHVYAEGECVSHVPRPAFVCILSALIGRALTAIRASRTVPGAIEIRASASSNREHMLLVEVFDSGDVERASHAEGADAASSGDALLDSVREHARQLGGELLVEADGSGTSVQLLLPLARASGGMPRAGAAALR